MSTPTIETILHEAEHLSFSDQLTLLQRLLETLRKTSQSVVDGGGMSVQQHLQQVLAKPARRKLKSLELDTRGFQFNRDEANER